jgi:hypothetical protein
VPVSLLQGWIVGNPIFPFEKQFLVVIAKWATYSVIVFDVRIVLLELRVECVGWKGLMRVLFW